MSLRIASSRRDAMNAKLAQAGKPNPTGADPDFADHSSTHANSVWVPHVRTSVRGLIKTGRSPIIALTTFPQSKIWVPHISLVFLARCGIPPLYPRRSSPPSVLRIEAEDGEPDLCVSGTDPGNNLSGPLLRKDWREPHRRPGLTDKELLVDGDLQRTSQGIRFRRHADDSQKLSVLPV